MGWWRRGLSTLSGGATRRAYVNEALRRLLDLPPAGRSAGYTSLMQWCGNAGSLDEARILHDHLASEGHHRRTRVANLLVQMYRKCGSLDEARQAFEAMEAKDTVSWNAIISAYAKSPGQSYLAIELFHRMVLEGSALPDVVTFISVLSACKSLSLGKCLDYQVHSSGLERDVVLDTAVVGMYSRCGSLVEAKRVFDSMARRSVVSWTVMITAFTQHGQPSKGLNLYRTMVDGSCLPNRVTYLAALAACSSVGDLSTGESIHKRTSSCQSLSKDCSLGSALVKMYAKCGRVDRAKQVFDSLGKRDIVAWSSMIGAFSQGRQAEEALKLYKSKEFEHLQPNSVTFIAALGACSQLGNLQEGKIIHDRVIESGFEEVSLGTSLVSMYGSCGSLEGSIKVFQAMKTKNLAAWNAMITAAGGLYPKVAFETFRKMEQEGIRADKVTFVCLLTSCSSTEDLTQGGAIHRRVQETGLLPDEVLETALLSMYSKCRRPEKARRVFESMRHRDVVAWTAIITAYSSHDGALHKEAMEIFDKMLCSEDGVRPNSTTFLNIIGSCSRAEHFDDGRRLEERVTALGLKTDAVENALLNMYCKCGSLEEARNFFETMEHRSTVSVNMMMTACVQRGKGREAIELYNKLRDLGLLADQTSVLIAISACSSVGALRDGKGLYESCGLAENTVIDNAIVNMYGKCGALDDAEQIFESIRDKSLVSWTSIIVGYAQHGHAKEAMQLYVRMHLEGAEPDIIMFMSTLIAFVHSGLVFEGRDCFVSMKKDWSIEPLVEHYMFMIDLLGRAGWLDMAEELVETMPFESEPVAWNTLLAACNLHNDIARGKRVGDRALQLNSREGGSHVLLSNICKQPR